MSVFRTEINPAPSSYKINHLSPLLFIGSCFTDNIGIKLKELRFNVSINPTGILYNPVSIKNSLAFLSEEKEYTLSDIGMFNELYYSFDHDTSFSHPVSKICLDQINTGIHKGNEQLRKASLIFLTFGTSWIYIHKTQQRIVANCHKIPEKEFERRLLSVEEIVSEFSGLINNITRVNPDVKFIFSVSPVRHWKDGAVGNQISKAILILAIHRLMELFPACTEYFPAYELLLDDLRDYRFYDEDLLHPGANAISYIWDKFSSLYFNQQTYEINYAISGLISARNHKPFHIETLAWRSFIAKYLKKTKNLREKYPFLNLSDLEDYFSGKKL